MRMLFDVSVPWEVRTGDASLHSCRSRPSIAPSQSLSRSGTPIGAYNGTEAVTAASSMTKITTVTARTRTLARTRSSSRWKRVRTGAGSGSGSGSFLTLLLVALLICLGGLGVDAWPYVDCSGPNPILALGQVTAYYDHANSSIGLELDGNFTNAYWAQGYTDAATSAWRTSIQTTLMGTQLYRSEGPACSPDGGIIVGGCPTAPGPGRLQTSFNISQSAPYAELMVTLQIVGSNNQSIVCVSILLEQTMPNVNTALSYLPLALACLSGTLGLVATMMRAAVGNGLLGAAATYGLASEAIAVHTPGFFDIIFYTQFMVMTGQLSVNYPSFYPTFTALFHWSFLEFKDSLAGKGPANATDVLKYGGPGSVNQNQIRVGNSTLDSVRDLSTLDGSNNNSSSSILKRDMDRFYREWREAKSRAIAHDLALQGVYESLRHGPSLTSRPLQRRQEITATTDTAVSSPTSSPSATTTTTTTTTTTSTDDSDPTPPSSRSPPRSKSTSARQPPPTRPPPSRTSYIAPTSTLVIPTITDPFTNTSGTNVQYNVSRFGIESYAAAIGAFPLDLFLGTLINAALAAVGSLLVSAALLGFAWIMAKEKHQRGKTLEHALNFVVGNLLRVWCLIYTPLALSAMYQLTISGSVARTVISAASLLILSVGATIFFTWRILRASSELLLYDDQGTLLKYGTLYNTLAHEGTLFFLVTLLVRFLWGLSVAMLSSFGVAQVAILMVVEVGYLLVIAVKWPYAESGDNKFHLFLSVIRIAITGCTIAYLPQVEASPEVRELFAYIQMSLHLAVFIVIFALLLWNLIQVVMFWKMRHSDKWKGPTKTYNFEDPIEGTEPGWGLTSRPLSGGGVHTRGIPVATHDGDDDDDGSGPARNKRFTVVSYSSLGSSSHNTRVDSMQRALHAPSSPHQQRVSRLGDNTEEDAFLYGSPAERYRQSRLLDNRRSRLKQSSTSEIGCAAEESIAERGLDTLVPLTAAAIAEATVNTAPAPPKQPSQTAESESGTLEKSSVTEQLGATSGAGVGLPQRESYANFQRMSQQQQDPRTRRMSDITRDGPHLYQPAKTEQDSSAVQDAKSMPSGSGGTGVLAGVIASLGNVFKFGRRAGRGASSNGNGTKPKPFEVIRPPRRELVQEPSSASSFVARHADETGSQVGGDQLRELNSLGISRFFQESDRGYEENRNLFVANPTAMISRNGSLVSSAESQRQQAPFAHSSLIRQSSGGTLASVQTLGHARSKGVGPSGLGTGATVSGAGVGSSLSHLPSAGSMRGTGTSTAGSITGSIAGDRASLMAGLAGLDSSSHSEHGGNTSNSDRDSRRASSARLSTLGGGSQIYPPRHSAESSNNIAEALRADSPLLLQGGGTLKVFKGPEKKAVRYLHDSATEQEGSAAEAAAAEAAAATAAAATASIAAPSMPPLLLPRLETNQQQITSHPEADSTLSSGSLLLSSPSSTSAKDQAKIRGGASGQDSSSTTSPTDSQPSPKTNIAASAGRMQEILGRIFPDSSIRLAGDMNDEGDDSESILSRGSSSTFSSHGQRAKVVRAEEDDDGPLDLLHVDDFDDSMSVEKYDMLMPVMEGDSDDDDHDSLQRMSTHSTQKLQHYPYQQQRHQEDYLTAGGSSGAFDPDRTPRQSMFDTRLVSNSSTPSNSTAAVHATGMDSRAGGVPRPSSSMSSSSTPEGHLQPGSSMTRTLSGPSSSGYNASSRPTSPAGASLHRQSGIQKVRSKSSFSSRPLAQTPLHSPSFQFASVGSLAPGSNSGSGSGSMGSGQGSSVSLPHVALGSSPGGYPSGLLGAEYLSRQSSVQSATSSRTDYQDAPSYFSDPYHSNNSSNSNYHQPSSVPNQSYLNRNPSIATVMTNRTDDSFVTAFSQEHSDEDEPHHGL
ncbi:hypothetical protein EMPS_01840 [Entomortierella parvispora]|uniref:TRP C-terminal domain-containing protein n=1 Tax=Entomortierella parvispora TaxID=205924 RepID=A0A9P3H3N0_9FUNG|nr:hypothetical protein EMPS_01840 [Entomortierella parvispora]